MPTQETKVRYNVDEAINELERLNDSVDNAGKKAKSSFGDADKGANKLTNAVTELNAPAGKFVALMEELGIVGGVAAAGVAATALAASSLAANFLNLPEILKDTVKQLEELKTGTREAQDIADASGTIRDELERRVLEVARQESALRRTELLEQAEAVNVRRQNANEQVVIERRKLSNLEKDARTSAKTLADIEKELQDKKKELAGEAIGRGKTAGGAVVDLTAAAASAARKGDTQQAEELLDKAKELSKELGNHAFFTNKIDAANNEIVRSLEKRAREARKESKEASSAVQAQDAQLKQIEERKKALDEEFRAIQRNRSLLRGGEQRIAIRRQQLGEGFNAAQAAADLQTARTEIERLSNAGITLGDILRDFARGVPQSLIRSNERAAELVEEFNKITGAATVTQGVIEGTPASLERAGNAAARIKEQLSQVTADPSFPEELRDEADRLESLIDTVKRAVGGGALAARAGIGETEEITSGAERIKTRNKLQQLDDLIAKDQEKIADNAERAAAAHERSQRATLRILDNMLPATPGPATQQQQPDNATVTPLAQAAPQTINVNATVRGGIIDRETTEQILDIVNREVRKLTTTAQ